MKPGTVECSNCIENRRLCISLALMHLQLIPSLIYAKKISKPKKIFCFLFLQNLRNSLELIYSCFSTGQSRYLTKTRSSLRKKARVMKNPFSAKKTCVCQRVEKKKHRQLRRLQYISRLFWS